MAQLRGYKRILDLGAFRVNGTPWRYAKLFEMLRQENEEVYESVHRFGGMLPQKISNFARPWLFGDFCFESTQSAFLIIRRHAEDYTIADDYTTTIRLPVRRAFLKFTPTMFGVTYI